MTLDHEKLSGFLDGELSPAETSEIEAALTADPYLQAELELLMAADTEAKREFDKMLSEPVPIALASAIQNAPIVAHKNVPQRSKFTGLFLAFAASVMLTVGGIGGYFIGSSTQNQIATTPTWLSDIADYHRVYAAQGRHLVEVSAEESAHIETWLTKSIGTDVAIPDLSRHSLEFQGARLLVAAGKPVAQLMFTDAKGKVVALCVIQSNKPKDSFKSWAMGDLNMVSWRNKAASFVVVGDENRIDLSEIANTASLNL